MKNSDGGKNLLLIFYEVEQFLGRIMFWRQPPEYRIVGPTADREYLYHEGDRILWICIEHLSGESGIDMLVYTDSVEGWDPPFDREVISKAKRQEILTRFGKHLTDSKARFQFQ